MVRIEFTVNEVALDKATDELKIFINGPDSWTSIVVRGDSTVELREKGETLYSLNLKAAAKFFTEHKKSPYDYETEGMGGT